MLNQFVIIKKLPESNILLFLLSKNI
jgi:hypothetical protein